MKGFVPCLRENGRWCLHEPCVDSERERIEALPNPSLWPVLTEVQIRTNGAGEREYRHVAYSAWREVPQS